MAFTCRKCLFGGEAPWSKQDWTSCDDRIRGGSSTSQISIKPSTVHHPSTPAYSSSAFFHGHLDITTLGGAGFASQRNTTNTLGWHLEKFDGLELIIGKSDGKRYSFILKDEMLPKRPDGREQSSLNWEFEFVVPSPKEGEEGMREGTVLRVKWCDFVPTYRGKPKEGLSRCIAANNIKRVTLMMRRSSPPACKISYERSANVLTVSLEGDQVDGAAPVRQDGEDMTEKLREQEQREQPPPAESMASKTTKEADEPKRPHLRGRAKNPILRFLSSCCGF
uniref:Uncharacterized protein C9E9.15 n=1 Tax=Talaromyces marneffei PM1 TaxID=1077442 RepID=A0A093V763_TALMA